LENKRTWIHTPCLYLESGRLILKNPSSEVAYLFDTIYLCKSKTFEEVATSILLLMSNLTHII
jgi:hypothetical protein